MAIGLIAQRLAIFETQNMEMYSLGSIRLSSLLRLFLVVSLLVVSFALGRLIRDANCSASAFWSGPAASTLDRGLEFRLIAFGAGRPENATWFLALRDMREASYDEGPTLVQNTPR